MTMSNEQRRLEGRLEEICARIGWLGKFTVRSYAILFTGGVFAAMNIASTVFLAGKMDYTCAVSEELQTNVSKQCGLNWTDFQSNLTFPALKEDTQHCEQYTVRSLVENASCSYWKNGESNTTFQTQKCNKWNYDQSIYESTIVSDFDLVCENSWKTNFSQFLLMVGVFCGAFLCGISADKWGRRKVLTVSMVISVVACVSSAATNYWMYAIVHMLAGFGGIGMCVVGYVYVMEISKDQHRAVVGQIMQCTFAVGFMLLPLFGSLIRNWVYLNLAVALPFLIIIPIFLCYSGETPRWLLSKRRADEAVTTLRMMAKVNGKDIEPFFDQTSLIVEVEQKPKEDEKSPHHSTRDLFRNPTLLAVSLILFYNWFAVTCLYYGLTLNATQLNGNPYLNFFLSGLVEFPAYVGSVFLLRCWGRRPAVFMCNMLSGIAMLCLHFTPSDASGAILTLYLISKCASAACFSCIYLYTSELYPTPLRGNGVGICSGCARLGGMSSQPIFMLSHINPSLPFVVLSSIAALAGFLVLILPETKGEKLPETVKDTETMYKHRTTTLMQQFLPCIPHMRA